MAAHLGATCRNSPAAQNVSSGPISARTLTIDLSIRCHASAPGPVSALSGHAIALPERDFRGTSPAQTLDHWLCNQFRVRAPWRPREREEVPMPIVGGLDIHRKQLTFDYLDTVTGEVRRGQIAPADREYVRAWLARFAGRDDVAFAVEGCAGWRYVTEELAAAGIAAHLAEPADTAAARGRKRHAKTDKTDARHLRTLLAEGRLPECWIPPAQILEYRALLELYHDLRREHTAWVQRVHAVFFHQGAPRLSEDALRTEAGLARLRAAAAVHLSAAGQQQVATALD